jgi:endonuclease/exonuclease/phosphatase family metal-dependent hydrolase
MSHSTLRVLTLNCWNISEPFAERAALIRAGIAALQPDLIGLQEIIVRRDGLDEGAVLLDGLGYHRVFGPAFRWDATGIAPLDGDADAFGNLIASRWPIRRHAVEALPGTETAEYRCAVAALIDAPFGSVPFVTTHLNWKFHHGAVRERQVVALADFTNQWAKGARFPPILAGDMNADPDSNEIRFLCGLAAIVGRSTYFQDAWRIAGDGTPGYTWDNRNRFAAMMFEPNRRIDYLFVGLANTAGRGWIDSVRVTMTEPHGEVFPSDHFGIVADVRI